MRLYILRGEIADHCTVERPRMARHKGGGQNGRYPYLLLAPAVRCILAKWWVALAEQHNLVRSPHWILTTSNGKTGAAEAHPSLRVWHR